MCFWIHMDLYGPTKCLHKKVSRYILFWAQLVTNLGFASLFNYPPFQWRKHPVSQGQMVPWAFRFITFMSNSHYLPLLFCTKPLKPPDTSASGACHLGLSVPSTGKTNDLLWAKPTSFFQVAKSYIQREENELNIVFSLDSICSMLDITVSVYAVTINMFPRSGYLINNSFQDFPLQVC